jgi:hypothetical protein
MRKFETGSIRKILLTDKRAFYSLRVRTNDEHPLGEFDGVLEKGSRIIFLGESRTLGPNVWHVVLAPDGRLGYVVRNLMEPENVFEEW